MTIDDMASAIRGTPTAIEIAANKYAHSGLSGGKLKLPALLQRLTAKY